MNKEYKLLFSILFMKINQSRVEQEIAHRAIKQNSSVK
jgi:hypothetical protein